MIPEVIQFLSEEETSDLKKERLTNDVRYQEFNEVTLDYKKCIDHKIQ